MSVSSGGDIQLVTHRERVLLDVQGVHWAPGPKPRIRDHSTIDLTLAEAARLHALLTAAIEGAGWAAAPDAAHAALPCSRHGTAYEDSCRECDHVRWPVPYDPPPSSI
jgi:hypothetical protein